MHRNVIGLPSKKELLRMQREQKAKEREEKRRLAKEAKDQKARERAKKAAEKKAEQDAKDRKKIHERELFLAPRIDVTVTAFGRRACFTGAREIQLPPAIGVAKYFSREEGYSRITGHFENEMTGEKYQIFMEFENGSMVEETWMK